EVYRRHGAAVLAAAHGVTADSTTAETTTADVFVELWDAPEMAAAHRDGLRDYLVTRAVALVSEDDRTP
ncbi:MAG: hypothetical protein QOJ09_1304, partial [Actinomycetota bacterium]|nr:hypothetical protein [Actinomycetota bacterium]